MGSSPDNDLDFTDEFCVFLQRCVANVDAAELLLALSKEPRHPWTVRELCAQLAPMTTLPEAEAERCIAVFEANGVVVRDAGRRVSYQAADAQDVHVARLTRLYVERPVTLFRVIYALRDSKINTFADAFNLRR